MPTYEYECQACQHRFEEIQSIKAEPLKVCPACKKPKLARLISVGMSAFDATPKTLGSIAERNTREMRLRGEEIPKSVRRNKDYAVPWWRTSKDGHVRKDILNNPEKYIKTGEV